MKCLVVGPAWLTAVALRAAAAGPPPLSFKRFRTRFQESAPGAPAVEPYILDFSA